MVVVVEAVVIEVVAVFDGRGGGGRFMVVEVELMVVVEVVVEVMAVVKVVEVVALTILLF